MSVLPHPRRAEFGGAAARENSRSVTVARAIVALIWAAALVIAVGHRVPTSHSDLPVLAAGLLATYPAIDVIASVLGALTGMGSTRVLVTNALISTAAVVALAITAFGADAASTLTAFGGWAAISGAILLAMAIANARAGRLQVSMVISGGLSTVAGIGFIAMSNSHSAHVKNLAGYMALGAVLFLISAIKLARKPTAVVDREPKSARDTDASNLK